MRTNTTKQLPGEQIITAINFLKPQVERVIKGARSGNYENNGEKLFTAINDLDNGQIAEVGEGLMLLQESAVTLAEALALITLSRRISKS